MNELGAWADSQQVAINFATLKLERKRRLFCYSGYFNPGHHVPLEWFPRNQSAAPRVIMQMDQADWIS